MSTNYESPRKREDRESQTTQWPQLIVPERTQRDRQKSTVSRERRGSYSGSGTSTSGTREERRRASASRSRAERQRASVSGTRAGRQRTSASGTRAGRQRTSASGIRAERQRVSASKSRKRMQSKQTVLERLPVLQEKVLMLLSMLKKFAGFSEEQSNVDIMKRIKHIFLFPAAFIYFEILLRIFGETGVFSHFIYPLIFSIAAGLFLGCITSVFKRKVNRVISIAALLAVGTLFIVECLVRDSFQVYMTLSSIMSGAGGVVGDFAKELVNSIVYGIPVILLFLLPGILYIILGKKIIPARRQKPSFVLVLLVFAFVFMGIGSLTASVGSSKAQYKAQYDFDTATKYFGLLTSVRLDSKYLLFGNDAAEKLDFETAAADAEVKEEKAEEKEEKPEKKEYGDNVADIDFAELMDSESNKTLANMHAYVNSVAPSKKNAYTGLFEGKNLILICAEALSDVAVNKNLTPTLYRMVHNGFYFSDFYQPSWGGSTSSGEYSFLTGLVPMDGAKSMLHTQNKNMYYTLGSQLQKQGYHSAAYHNGNYDYYSRHLTHENLGYDEYLATGNGIEDITGKYPKDTVMFDKTMDLYMDKEPFSIYYMTISGHSTYLSGDWRVKEHMDAVKEEYGDKYKETTNNYLCYQMELENALKTMVEKLEEAGIADNTVICITSDHYPYGLEKTSTFGNTEDYVADLYGYKPENSWENDHNTCVIWSGCLENDDKDMACEIDAPTYSLDIVPTLLNLFGLEYDSRLLVGRDVFSDADPLVVWNNRSWITDKGKYDSAKGKFYPNEGVTVSDDYIDSIKSIVANKLTYSSQVIKNDYFEKLFDK